MTDKPVVLVVEDEREIRYLISLWLKKWGYEPAEATSPEAAKNTSRPALAIIDLRLQGRLGAGVELCRWVKEAWKIPVIATTAYDSTELRDQLEPFIDAFCIKPRVIDCIRRALNRLLPLAGPGGQTTTTPPGAD